MKTILLTQGKMAVVDDDDFERLNAVRWCAVKVVSKNRILWYAVRNAPQVNGKRRLIYMHREVLGAGARDKIDHRNSDGLDNQRENLRIATVSQNRQNQRKSSGLTSVYKGVYWNKRLCKWQVQIKIGGRGQYLGVFESESEAGAAYDRAARRLFNDFALLNSSQCADHTFPSISSRFPAAWLRSNLAPDWTQ